MPKADRRRGRKARSAGAAGFSVDIDQELLDEFLDVVEGAGWIKRRAVEAALRHFCRLPGPIQLGLMNPDTAEAMTKSMTDAIA